MPIAYLALKVFCDAKTEFLVYWAPSTLLKIFGFHADITHKLVIFTANMFQVKFNHKPKPMDKILNDVVLDLLLMMQKPNQLLLTPAQLCPHKCNY